MAVHLSDVCSDPSELSPEDLLLWIITHLQANVEVNAQDISILVDTLSYDYTILQSLVTVLRRKSADDTYPASWPSPRLGILIAVERQIKMIDRALKGEETPPDGSDYHTRN